MKTFLRWLLHLLFNTKVIGQDQLSFTGPSIILPNHVSFWDAIFLYAYLPSGTCFVVNTTIARNISFVLKWVNHIIIDPLNPYSLKTIVSVVKTGTPVVLFPEGRLTLTGNLMKVYNGIGFIALKTSATLHPVIFLGLERSKMSRVQTKVKSRWFPAVTMYMDQKRTLTPSPTQNIRQQKQDSSARILDILQQAMFKARQHQEQCVNLFDKLLVATDLHGSNKTMAEDINGSITYRQGTIGSYVLADKLRPLLIGQDQIGVLLPNSIGHLITLFALCYLGKTPAILNFSAGAENNLDCGATAGLKTILTSRLFITKGRFEELIARLETQFHIVYLEDVKEQMNVGNKISGLVKYLRGTKSSGEAGVILFTSGSESKPKGVLLRQSNMIANINQIASIIDYSHNDKMLNALPMFHSFGLTAGTLLPVFGGIEVFLYPSPLHYKIVPEIVYDRNATILIGTPTFLHGYAKYAHHYDFYNLRYVLAGGEKLRDEVRKIWHDKFGLRIFEGYGTTETAPVLSINTPLFNQSGSVGKFLPGIEWRTEAIPGIEEGGNLFVKGPNVMAGYLLHGQGFVPAPEWYDCGDVVSIDKQGFVTIRSRLKRFAKVSGEMVSLDAVEKTAETCFGGTNHAAINLPDSRKGERIVLYTMEKNATKQMLRECITKLKQSMLAMPSEVFIIDKLPLLGTGKTDYVTLKAMAHRKGENDE